jgi:HJR/Mrr/RecB family endonuclease
MTPYEFEFAVENDFRNQGFDIIHVGKSFDKGVDFVAEDSEQRIAIQVKIQFL